MLLPTGVMVEESKLVFRVLSIQHTKVNVYQMQISNPADKSHLQTRELGDKSI